MSQNDSISSFNVWLCWARQLLAVLCWLEFSMCALHQLKHLLQHRTNLSKFKVLAPQEKNLISNRIQNFRINLVQNLHIPRRVRLSQNLPPNIDSRSIEEDLERRRRPSSPRNKNYATDIIFILYLIFRYKGIYATILHFRSGIVNKHYTFGVLKSFHTLVLFLRFYSVDPREVFAPLLPPFLGG